jgi:hypothetical protein
VRIDVVSGQLMATPPRKLSAIGDGRYGAGQQCCSCGNCISASEVVARLGSPPLQSYEAWMSISPHPHTVVYIRRTRLSPNHGEILQRPDWTEGFASQNLGWHALLAHYWPRVLCRLKPALCVLVGHQCTMGNKSMCTFYSHTARYVLL